MGAKGAAGRGVDVATGVATVVGEEPIVGVAVGAGGVVGVAVGTEVGDGVGVAGQFTIAVAGPTGWKRLRNAVFEKFPHFVLCPASVTWITPGMPSLDCAATIVGPQSRNCCCTPV